MKILLVGATGLLGKKLLQTQPKDHQIISTYKTNNCVNSKLYLDITNLNNVQRVIEFIKPDMVIHAASIGDVDYCQNHPRQAWQVNVIGTKYLLSSAKRFNLKFIFFSSNAIFDGNHSPYNEKSLAEPINFYGKTKIAAEKLVKDYKSQAIILRLSTMYGWNNIQERDNPATWLIYRLKKHQHVKVVNDIYNNHLWVGQAVQAVWQTIKLRKFGEIFHIAGRDCISRFEFAKELADIFNFQNSLIEPTSSSEFKYLAPRPRNACLLTTKMQSELGIKPICVRSGLKLMFKESLLK